jgi:pimeloyl-ACP methyl ester carboxylesterase
MALRVSLGHKRRLGRVPAIPPAKLERMAVSTILIWGRRDPVARLRVAEAAGERFGWPLRVIDGAADDPPIEQPEAFLQASTQRGECPRGSA